jgi:hypothetical protein
VPGSPGEVAFCKSAAGGVAMADVRAKYLSIPLTNRLREVVRLIGHAMAGGRGESAIPVRNTGQRRYDPECHQASGRGHRCGSAASRWGR